MFVCPLFWLKWPYHLLLFKLVMVRTGYDGRHSHFGGIELADTVTITLLGHFAQLRRARGKFSNFVLIHIARLSVETNSLTGTCFSPELSTQTLYLTSCWASAVITIIVLYAAFPVSWTEIGYDPSSDLIASFTEWAILCILVRSHSSSLCAFLAHVPKVRRLSGNCGIHYTLWRKLLTNVSGTPTPS